MLNAALLRTKPWNDPKWPKNEVIFGPRGMVGPEERSCYYWLARNWHSMSGCIVDAGCFLGASTNAFAAGAADAGHRRFHSEKLVHAFDYFRVVDRYVGEAISRDFRPIGADESYLDIFELQTRAYADMIQTYGGDFMAQRWIGEPIEILFIDIAKTAELNAHACGQFFPHLISGKSLILQQDYYHCWHPYIHIAMEFLADELELVDDHVLHQTAVWRLVKPIPQGKIDRLANYDLTAKERLALLDRAIAKASPVIRPMLEVVRAWQLFLDHEFDLARAQLAAVDDRYDGSASNALWAKQAREILQHLSARTK